MTLAESIRSYLFKENVDYEILEHPPTYTALETAGSQHVPGRRVLKSVIIKANSSFLMCVVPSTHRLDFEKLKLILKTKDVRLASEAELSPLFPECQLGAEPPFGPIYGLQVYAQQILEENDEVLCNAGTHTEMIKLKLIDFQRLAKPIFADISTHI